METFPVYNFYVTVIYFNGARAIIDTTFKQHLVLKFDTNQCKHTI